MKARSRLALTRLHTKSRASIGADALAAASMRSGSPLTLRREDPTGWLGAMTAALAAGAYQRMVEEAARALAPDLAAPLEAMVRYELALGHFELGHLDRARVSRNTGAGPGDPTELEASRQLVADGGESGAGFHHCRPGTAAGP